MLRFLSCFFTCVVTSLYFFPFEFTALPGLNTKMLMAAVGLVICGYHLIQKHEFRVSNELFTLSLISFGISLMALFSVAYNSTPDYTYVTYFISMWVWLSAAYVVCTMIHKVHGKLTVELVCHYLIVICVTQCIMAIIIDYVPSVKNIVDTYISQDQVFLNHINRLYGIGAWLDVAGTRFAACLVIIVFLLHKNRFKIAANRLCFYIISYLIVTVVGSIIARTTLVGNVISLIYLLCILKSCNVISPTKAIKLWGWILLLLFVIISIISYLYDTNEQFKKLFRHGFEVFFNWFEKGSIETNSTNKLKDMYVFPETLKTWILGDGYYINPYRTDMYYIGQKYYAAGYYMLTDVGYLRFIFYFGLIGLLGFLSLIIVSTRLLINKLPQYKYLFLMFMAVNLIVWFKVSTDIFLVFALFFAIPPEDNAEYDKLVALENEDTI